MAIWLCYANIIWKYHKKILFEIFLWLYGHGRGGTYLMKIPYENIVLESKILWKYVYGYMVMVVEEHILWKFHMKICFCKAK